MWHPRDHYGECGASTHPLPCSDWEVNINPTTDISEAAAFLHGNKLRDSARLHTQKWSTTIDQLWSYHILLHILFHRPVPSRNHDSRGSNKFCHHKHQKHPTNGAKTPSRWCHRFRLHPPCVQGTLHGGVLTPQVGIQHQFSGPHKYPHLWRFTWPQSHGPCLPNNSTLDKPKFMVVELSHLKRKITGTSYGSVWYGNGRNLVPKSLSYQIAWPPRFSILSFWTIPKRREITIGHMLQAPCNILFRCWYPTVSQDWCHPHLGSDLVFWHNCNTIIYPK